MPGHMSPVYNRVVEVHFFLLDDELLGLDRCHLNRYQHTTISLVVAASGEARLAGEAAKFIDSGLRNHI
jgi:hypothetical protein